MSIAKITGGILVSIALTDLTFLQVALAQNFPERDILKQIKADQIRFDKENGDGVFRARNKKNQKWGMYQWQYSGAEVTELIPMLYDSVRNFPFNGSFTAVYNKGKVGFYLSKWSYGEKAKQIIPCAYESYQRYTPEDGITRLAVQKGGKWGWVDWLTGEERSEFIYETKEDLPYPDWEQKTTF